VFCREPKVPVASMRRLQWIGGRKACVIKRAEAEMWRWRTDHRSEVPEPARDVVACHWPAKGSVLI
jgi:hypothetical protein